MLKKKQEMISIDMEIEWLTQQIEESTIDDSNREDYIRDLGKLVDIRNNMRREPFLDPNLFVRLSLGSIVIFGILKYEKRDIITTKSFDIGKRLMSL